MIELHTISTSATDRATSAASSGSTRPSRTSRASRTSRCTRCSIAARSRRGSPPPTRRLHHHPARAGPRQPGLQGARPARARRRSGDRPRPLLDHGLQRVGELAARASQRRLRRQPPRARAGPQRQPHQRRRAPQPSCARRACTFTSTSDSEIIAALLATHPAEKIEDAVADVMPRLKGAFSTVVMTKDSVVAFRDPAGLRPLVLGQIGDRYCVASRVVRVRHHRRDAAARRAAGRGRDALARRASARARSVDGEREAFCVFEYIYFARPDSRMNGDVLQAARGRMGEILAREAPAPGADLVIAVPDSGNAAARGFARAAGLPQDDGFIKNRYVARTFIQPGPGAAQARPADEVQPAAGDRRRQAARRRRRLDRARQHHAPDRADAARRRRARGPHADLGAADQAPVPLRHRHVHARGDDRPRAARPTRSRAELGVRLAGVPVARGRLRGGQRRPRPPLRRLLHPASTRSRSSGAGQAKDAFENALPLVKA